MLKVDELKVDDEEEKIGFSPALNGREVADDSEPPALLSPGRWGSTPSRDKVCAEGDPLVCRPLYRFFLRSPQAFYSKNNHSMFRKSF